MRSAFDLRRYKRPRPILLKVTRKGSHWLWAWSSGLEGSTKYQAEAFKFLTWATSPDYIRLGAARRGWVAVPPGTKYSTFGSPGYRGAAAFAPIVEDSINTADSTDAALQRVPYTGVQYVGIPEFAEIGTKVSQLIAAAIGYRYDPGSAAQSPGLG